MSTPHHFEAADTRHCAPRLLGCDELGVACNRQTATVYARRSSGVSGRPKGVSSGRT